MGPALRVESRKLRRSRVVLVASLLQALLVPLLSLLLLQAAGNGAGVLAGKGEALVVGEGWDAYLGVLGQVAAAALFVGAGVVVAWVFGREHADGTFGALFSLPVSRGDIALAKLVAFVAWVLVVGVAVTGVAAVLGVAGGVDPASTLPPPAGLVRLLGVAGSTMLLTVPVALVASVGRGYLPAIGAVVVVLAVAQVSVFLGAGGWFPFAVPGLVAVADGTTVVTPGPAQLALAGLTVLVGAAATVAWWARAEVA